MKPEDRDAAAIFDMLERARRAVHRLGALSFEDFQADEDSQDVVVHCLEIIGEAAGRISPSGRAAHPDVPWKLVVATHNRLIHDYSSIDLEAVWNTVTRDLPPLVAALERHAR